MFGIPTKDDMLQVIAQAPSTLIQGIVQAISAPPKAIHDAWEGFTPAEQETLKQAGKALLMMGAEYAIARSKKNG